MPALDTSTSTGPSSASTALNAASTSALVGDVAPRRRTTRPAPRCRGASRRRGRRSPRTPGRSPDRCRGCHRSPARCVAAHVSASDASGSRGGRPPSGPQPVPAAYGRVMRAIQITEFGGPETLVVRDLPDPGPTRAAGRARRPRRRHQLRRHPPDRELLPRRADAAADPRRRGGRARPRRSPAARSVGSGGYAERVAADPRAAVPGPRRGQRRRGADDARAGRDGLAPAAHQHAPAAGRDGRGPRRRRRRRAPWRSSWRSAGAPAGSSPPPPARTSGRSPSSSAPTSPSTRAPRTSPPRCARRTTAAVWTSCSR